MSLRARTFHDFLRRRQEDLRTGSALGYTMGMAMRARTIVAWAGAVAAGAGLAAWLLSLAAASALRERIVAEAAERYDAQAELGQVSVRLMPGRVSIDRVTLRRKAREADPAGVLSAVRVTAWGSLPGLLGSGERRIRRLEAEGVTVAVERTAEHGTRLVVFTRPPRGAPAPDTAPAATAAPRDAGTPIRSPTPPSSPPAKAAAPAVSYRVERLDVRGLVRFVDTSVRDTPFTADLVTRLEGTDLHWRQGQPADRGTLRLTGHAAAAPSAWVFAVEAGAVPPTGGGWSFEATGTVANAQPAMAAPYLEPAGVTCSNLDIRIALSCRAGRFAADHSTVTLAMRSVSLTGKQARKTGMEGTLLDAVTLDVPVSGELARPEFNLTYALLGALTGKSGGPAAADMADQLLKHAGQAAVSALGKWLDRHAGGEAGTNPPAASPAPPLTPTPTPQP